MEIARVDVMGNGHIEVSQLAGNVAQHEPGHMGIWLGLCSSFKIRSRRFRTDPLPLSQTFVDQFARTWRRCGLRRGRGRRLDGRARHGAFAGRSGSRRAPAEHRS